MRHVSTRALSRLSTCLLTLPGVAATCGMASPSPPAAPLCAVCLSDIAQPQLSTLLECAHAFCVSCIAAWAARGQRLCPLCRASFTGWRHAFDADDAEHFLTHTLPVVAALERTADALRAATAADEAQARQARRVSSPFTRFNTL